MREPDDAQARRGKPPVVVYPVGSLPPPDMAMLARARDNLTKISEVVVPPREGRAFPVPAGHFFRIVSIEGPQVGDLNLWNATRSVGTLLQRQDAGAARNACRQRRPVVEHVAVSAADGDHYRRTRSVGTVSTPTAPAYTTSSARAATPTPTCCCPADDYHHCCHSNLSRALAAARGMDVREAELLVHDVLNVFMCTGFTRDTHQYFMKASPVRPGDFIEFFAEIDLLARAVGLPGRRLRHDAFKRHRAMLPAQSGDLRPAAGSLVGWQPAPPSQYPRTHGVGE